MPQFIYQHSYLSVLAGIILTGELGIFAGAFLIQKGLISTPALIIIGTISSFVAGIFYFYLGKFLFERLTFLRKKFGKNIYKSSRIVNKYGNQTMIISRFLYGIRNVIPLSLGIYKVKQTSFLIFNLLGAILWSVTFTYLGLLYSHAAISILGKIKNVSYIIIISIVFLIFIYFAVRFIIKKLHKQ